MVASTGVVYTKDGQYLRITSHMTYVGFKEEFSWVDDINQASVFYGAPSFNTRRLIRVEGAQALKVVEARSVVVLSSEVSTAAKD